MQVSVEKTSELSRKMTVTVPEDIVQEKVNERLKSLAREVKVDGFRPGKVPQKVVQKMYGARVKEEITGDLIQKNYIQALQDNDIRPAGMPQIEPEPVESEEGFSFSAIFEVYPEFTLDAVETIEVNKPVANVVDSDVDAMVDKLKSQKKDWQASEADSQEGDHVTINFTGTSEGENFTNRCWIPVRFSNPVGVLSSTRPAVGPAIHRLLPPACRTCWKWRGGEIAVVSGKHWRHSWNGHS